MKPFMEERGWKNAVYYEEGLARSLQVSAMPTTVVFGKNGIGGQPHERLQSGQFCRRVDRPDQRDNSGGREVTLREAAERREPQGRSRRNSGREAGTNCFPRAAPARSRSRRNSGGVRADRTAHKPSVKSSPRCWAFQQYNYLIDEQYLSFH